MRLGLRYGAVDVVPHEPGWAGAYEDARRGVGDLFVDVQHVGSTSVRGLDAKPIIDIAAAVASPGDIAAVVPPLTARGWIDRGDKEQQGGHLLVLETAPGHRTHHLHIVVHGDAQWTNYLRFRDLLREDAAVRDEYASVKRTLHRLHPDDRGAYRHAKNDVVSAILCGVRCRPMTPDDFGNIESRHWESADHVRSYIEKQGVASMLAFQQDRCVGQLYLQEYDPGFRESGGWTGERPWADFRTAEPLGLRGRFLTLGCYHAESGHGIATALLRSVLSVPAPYDGLLAWGVVAGSAPLLQWAGQLPHTTYRRFGFREITHLHDDRLARALADVDTSEADEDPALLRVMVNA